MRKPSVVRLSNLSKITWLVAVRIRTGIQVWRVSNALGLSHRVLYCYAKMSCDI